MLQIIAVSLNIIIVEGVVKAITIFFSLYFISFGAMYYLSYRAKGPMVVPGDIYKNKGGRVVYIPTGGALILAILLFVLLKAFIPNF